MSMSKKDFIALADSIKETSGLFTEAHLWHLADFCQSSNPNFKRERWIDYIAGKCGKNGRKVK
jgi:hypothetical protein